MTKETDLMRAIQLAYGVGTTRLFRNNVGALEDKNGRLVRFGLGTGSSDLIGVSMTQNGIGRFVALEVKLPGQKPTREQLAFIEMVKAMGGLAGVAYSVDDAGEILKDT